MSKQSKGNKKPETFETKEVLETLDQGASRVEQFVERNQKYFIYGIIGVFAVIAIGWAYQNFYVKNREAEANKYMFAAKTYFAQDSLDQALNGDGKHYGFVNIAEKYGSTASGNLANYFAGASYLKKGDYKKAIEYLGKFKSDDEIAAAEAVGMIGDAFSELTQYDEALEYYQEAAKLRDNDLTTPMYLFKAGLVAMELGKKDVALENFTKITENYKESQEFRASEKYVAMLTAK